LGAGPFYIGLALQRVKVSDGDTLTVLVQQRQSQGNNFF
jgi:hypothetical protein